MNGGWQQLHYIYQPSALGVSLWGSWDGLLIQGELEYTTISTNNTGEVVHAKFHPFP